MHSVFSTLDIDMAIQLSDGNDHYDSRNCCSDEPCNFISKGNVQLPLALKMSIFLIQIKGSLAVVAKPLFQPLRGGGPTLRRIIKEMKMLKT
jgi:hypothetical protein